MSKIIIDKETIEGTYNKHRNIINAANELGIGKNTFSRLMKEYGIPTVGVQGARKNFYNEKYFDIIDTEEKAYWLGFIYAVGCVYRGSDKHSYRLQINLKQSDEEHLVKFQNAIGSNYKLYNNLNTKSVSLKVNSTRMCEDLIRHGVVCSKSLIVKPPKIKDELIRHFVRGLFDGDGSISWLRGRTPKVTIITGSEELANWLKYRLSGFNIYIYKRTHDLYSLESQSVSVVKDFYNTIYSNANVCLNRKYIKFDDIVNNKCPLQE